MYLSPYYKHIYNDLVLHKYDLTVLICVSEKESDTGLAPWAFILIGIAALVVIVIPLTTAFIYYRKKLALQNQPSNTIPTIAETTGLM